MILECPAVAFRAYETERKATKKMQRGTLIDQLVLGGRQYEVCEPVLKSGPRKGQISDNWLSADAKEMQANCVARGYLPVLHGELDSALEAAGRVRAKLLADGIELENEQQCHRQFNVKWDSIVPCEGTLDLLWLVKAIVGCDDLKVSETANPRQLRSHIYEQGWHIQAAAYEEARRAAFPGHTMGPHNLLIVDEKHDIISRVPLGESYMEAGRADWTLAQKLWRNCWASGHWPEYSQAPIQAPRWVMETIYGQGE
jgi:hypothetical protein